MQTYNPREKLIKGYKKSEISHIYILVQDIMEKVCKYFQYLHYKGTKGHNKIDGCPLSLYL